MSDDLDDKLGRHIDLKLYLLSSSVENSTQEAPMVTTL